MNRKVAGTWNIERCLCEKYKSSSGRKHKIMEAVVELRAPRVLRGEVSGPALTVLVL